MEHYGLEIPACTIRKITEEHAKRLTQIERKTTPEGAKRIIVEIDGGMVPILEIGEKAEEADLRKIRKVCWKEAKLCFARADNKINREYDAVIGTAEEAGKKLYNCAIRAGLVETTYVHALGDGAQWIADQIETQFGTQAHFLVDFFHMSEYLAEASIWCNILDKKAWLEEKKKQMKSGEQEKVFCELKTRLETLEKVPEESGLVKCIRYMEKRIKYMNYEEVSKKGLPIGSGEIESSHRHIVQKRLKIAGAWWKTENANKMLQLRVGRASGYWKAYWNEAKAA